MSRNLKIFISSPGDVIPERELARKVIGELNEEMMGKVFLVPVLWEKEPLLASGTFQTQIESVEDTQILLGILWSRIGSPLPDSILRPDGSRYDSGTAFEFETALASHHEKGKPDILLYRKLGAPSVSLDDRKELAERLEQMDRLDSYIKKQLMAEDGSYLAAFHTFETEEKFEEKESKASWNQSTTVNDLIDDLGKSKLNRTLAKIKHGYDKIGFDSDSTDASKHLLGDQFVWNRIKRVAGKGKKRGGE